MSRWMLSVVCLAACCAVACRDAREARNADYTFSLNGEPVRVRGYSLEGDPARLKPGDVIEIVDSEFNYDDLLLTLGEERACRFVTKLDNPGQLFLETASGRLKTVAAIVSPIDRGSGSSRHTVARNPLEKMSRSEIRGLWGIYLRCWPPGFEKYLSLADMDRVCLTLRGAAAYGEIESGPGESDGKPLPPLSPKLRHIAVDDSRFRVSADYSALGRFGDLVFASFNTGVKEGIDIRLVSQNRNLRCLAVRDSGLVNAEAMSQLTELRALDLSHSTGFDNVDFVRPMRRLTSLSVSYTEVTSLSALDGSSSIQEIEAVKAPVKDVPAGELPSLRVLNMFGAKVTKEVAEPFMAAHPQCLVHFSWKDSLQRAVERADRLRLLPHLITHPGEVLFETTDPNAIRDLVDHIDIDEAKSGGHINEDSLHILDFYRGDERLARIGCVFVRGLRWESGGPWPGDAILTAESSSFLRKWLEERKAYRALLGAAQPGGSALQSGSP